MCRKAHGKASADGGPAEKVIDVVLVTVLLGSWTEGR
jgi:hypothetical protein